MQFLIDQEEVGSFYLNATGGNRYTYSNLVYYNTSLSPGFHEITLRNGRRDGNTALMLLDYIVYT